MRLLIPAGTRYFWAWFHYENHLGSPLGSPSCVHMFDTSFADADILVGIWRNGSPSHIVEKCKSAWARGFDVFLCSENGYKKIVAIKKPHQARLE